MSNSLIAAVKAEMQGASDAAIAEALRKVESAELAAFVVKHLRPLIDLAYHDLFGVSASKAASSPFAPFLVSASALISSKIISDSIRETGAQTVEILKEIDAGIASRD